MKTPSRILVTEPIPEKVLGVLKQTGDVSIGEKGQFQEKGALEQVIESYDALLTMLSVPVSTSVIQRAKKLKIIANFAVGYNNIDVDSARAAGIKVANTPDVLTEACADFTIGLLIATTRSFIQAESALRNGAFKGWEPLGFLGMDLNGKKLGIFGMGRIGKAVAKRAQVFGLSVLYHNRSRLAPEEEKALNVEYVDNLETLASRSDILSIHCPLTPETTHRVNAEILSLLPSHACLINTSRGPIVDEEALANALHQGIIGSAGLDVYELEPHIHPKLLTAPNCTLLPHIASATHETREAIGMLAANAIRQVLSGVPDHRIPNLIRP
ncbi:MAG: D-glycerate dehydrogenase [Bacteroidota bacterium]